MNPICTIRRLACILAGLTATAVAFAAAPAAAFATLPPPEPAGSGAGSPVVIPAVATVGMPGWQIALIAAGAALVAAVLAVIADRVRAARRRDMAGAA